MKLFHHKKEEVKLATESKDDLWVLTQVIEEGNSVSGSTIRKIKIGDSNTDRNVKIVKKHVFLTLNVEQVTLDGDALRISGKITNGPEDVTRGTYHTITVEDNATLTIVKEYWPKYQLQRIKEATKTQGPKILMCVMDREEAYLALMKRGGYDILCHLTGNVQKKAVEEKVKGDFYKEIIKKIEEHLARYKAEHIILASPAFFKEDLLKQIKEDSIKKKITLATCNAHGKAAIDEVLKREETKAVLREERIAKEMKQVEALLAEIAKDGAATYGIQETNQAANAGAIKELLVTDKCIQETREKNQFEQLDKLMKTVDMSGATVILISSEHDGGQKLDGLGGVGAILRYKLV